MLEQDNDQIQQRKRHLADIAALGHPVYPTRFDRTHTVTELFTRYHQQAGKKEGEELEAANQALKAAEGGEVRIAGRIMTMRLMGKTAFAINIAEHVALNEGLPVAVFSMEMGASQLAVRVVGSIGRIDQGHLRTGKLSDEEWPRLTEAIERLRTVSLHIDETPGLTPSELRANARRLARQCGKLGLIVVDYLQLMSGSSGSGGDNRATELGEISRGLKMLAKELQCPVIALSQLNRSVEQRTDKRPMMSDLRESGAIEQDADIIMFIYRDDYYNKDSKDPGVAEIIIGKQRNGPTGTVRLAFLKPLTRFESLAPGFGGGGDDY